VKTRARSGGLSKIGRVGRVAVLVAVAAAPAARAAAQEDGNGDGGGQDDARARAQQRLAQGNDLFRAGDAAGALRRYREAYDIFQSAKLFFNIGRCEEALAQRAAAMRDLSRFLREAEGADPLVRAEAQERVTALGAALVAVDLSRVPANAAIRVDGQPAGLTPLGGPLWLEPGAHQLSVESPGRALWVTSVTGEAGAQMTIAVPDEPPRPPKPIASAKAADRAGSGGAAGGSGDHGRGLDSAPTPDSSGGWRKRWWLWAALGVVVVGGVATALVIESRQCPATTCP
jgi:hypothetical protein